MERAAVTEGELGEARSLLADLIAIYSPSGGEGPIVDHLEAWAGAHDLTSRRVPAEIGRDSLVIGACADPLLAIVAHVDTITPTWPGATVPRTEGDVVHGLGAVDDKGGVVACMMAALAFQKAGGHLDDVPAVFAFAVDEETGGSGSRSLAVDLAPRFAIALEGTGLRPGTAECGDLEALVHVSGVSAHGSLELGDNAVHAAARLIAGLPSLGLAQHRHPLLGESRASVNEIATGDGMNVVPDRCTLRLQIKLVPGQDLRETIRLVSEYCAGFNATLQMVEGTVPFELPAGSPLRAVVDRATEEVRGARPEPLGVPAWTDAHNFVDFGGSEAMVFGPGSIDSAHTPAEHIDVTQIAECARIFATLLEPPSIAAITAAPSRPDQPRYRKAEP
ncbi:MAG TPA: M20/M25/M40 family metallo-hydrolase [Solirubrobacterales bacterium]|nr:M20/M25/M40 family metallo-hydrolase [Solirubrobacterales bacterium]